MTDVSKFFTALSERAYKENDLSDVTYAMCEADPVFKQFFLDFFFKDQNLNAKDCTLYREVAYPDGSRPDLVVREKMCDKNARVYFVEVKIWDGSHHFAQYKNTLCNHENIGQVGNHFGYIANYAIEENQLSDADREVYRMMESQSRVKTWGDFAEALKKDFKNSPLVEAYLDYLLRVCPYDDFNIDEGDELNVVDHFKIVADLYLVISAIVEKNKDENALEGVSPYNRSSRQFQSMRRMGRYFEFTKSFKETESTNESSIWGWLGVVYEKVGGSWGARVCVEFEDTPGWGKKVCNKYNGMVKNGVLRFYYNGDLATNDLRDFVKNVLTGKIQPGDAQCDTSFNALLMMKILPFAIEKYFYGKLNDEWMVEKGYDSDEENPTSHCGRYFKLRKISNTEDASSGKDDIPLGWVGVVFNGGVHFDGGSDAPVFIVQLPKCDGIFNLNGWSQDKCSKYWWNTKLNLNSSPATVQGFAKAFRGCLENVLLSEESK